MLIINDMLLNGKNRPRKKLLGLKAVVIHYTGSPFEHVTAPWIRNYFNTTSTAASAHYTVDKDQIVRMIPDDEVAWHAGGVKYTPAAKAYFGGSPNNWTIGIEICNNSGWDQAVERAAHLTAHLLKIHNLSVAHLWRHFDCTGKTCPAPMINQYNYKWDEFRARVDEILKTNTIGKVRDVKDYTSTPLTGTATVTANTLNVRTAPDANSTKIGSLANGAKVNVIEKMSNGWYKINYNGKNGYVSGEYVKFENIVPSPIVVPNPTPQPVTNTVSALNGTATIISSTLNVRISSDNTNANNIIGVLNKGDKVKVTGQTSNNWYRVEYNSKVGYISGSSQYVSFQKDMPQPTEMVTNIDGQLRALVGSLNVRSSASVLNNNVIGNLNIGDIVKVTGKCSNGWYRILYNGRMAYVSGDPKYVAFVTAKKGVIIASSLNIRSAPALNGSIVGSLKKGDIIEYYPSSTGWVQIYYNGKIAYTSSMYIK